MAAKPNARTPCKTYDKNYLKLSLLGHIDLYGAKGIFKMGDYDSIPRGNATSGVGLLKKKELLYRLLEACPSAECHYSVMKQTIRDVMKDKPESNPGPLSMSSDWIAGHIADVIGVMFTHLRKIKNDQVRWRQCCTKLECHEIEDLERLVMAVSDQVLTNSEYVCKLRCIHICSM